jgi:ketosteroid isomerase-like protein
MSLKISAAAAVAALSVLSAGQAFADAGLAKAHIEAIAKGDVAGIAAGYTDTTVFEWVGGPLDGVYTGKSAIEGVWAKFAKVQGPLKAEVTDLRENANPKGATVTADVKFSGKNTIPVRYVMTFRDKKLVAEIWQIDPKLGKY